MKATVCKSLIWAVIALVLLIYVIFFELMPKPMSMEGFELFGLRHEEIKKIEIINEYGKTTFVNPDPQAVLVSDGQEREVALDPYQGWYIEENPTARLDKGKLSSLMHTIIHTKVYKPFDMLEDLSVYGLQNPGLSIKVETLKDTFLLEIGDKSSYLNSYFARYNGNSGFMIAPEILKIGVNKTADFREKRILPVDERSIAAINIVRGDHQLLLTKDEHEKWNITKPDYYVGDQENIKMLIASLLTMSTDKFYELKDNEFQNAGLEYPEMKIEVLLSDGSSKKIVFSVPPTVENREQLFVYLDGDAHFSSIDLATLGKFPLSIYALRKKHFIDIVPEDIESFSITHENSLPIYLEKIQNGWLVNGEPADLPFVENFLRKLPEIMAVDFPDYKEVVDFSNYRIKISLKTKSGKEKTIVVAKQVRMPAPNNLQYYIIGTDTSEPYVITSTVYQRISPFIDTFKVISE